MRQLSMLVYNKLVTLNLFSVQHFGNNIDERTLKILGQWATRLYIILLTVGLVILALYTTIQPQTLTEVVDKPSITEYNRLMKTHGDRLKCSCSLIASKYDRFIKIQPVFHQVKRNYSQSMRLPLR